MYQKVKQYLNERYLAWIILDSIPQARLVSLISRLSIGYIGVRITSIPVQDLAYDLSEEAFAHNEIMDVLIKTLNEMNSEDVQMISQMSEDRVRVLTKAPGNFYLDKKIGKLIWALLSDARQSINELIPDFLRTLENTIEMEKDFAREKVKEIENIDSILSSKRGFKKLLRSISLYKEEITREKRLSEDLMRENKRLKEKNIERQNLIQQLNKSCGEFVQEKGLWHKQIGKKDAQLLELERQLKELKDQLAVGPKMRLKSEIHQLQKENNKLNYILEKERQENNAKIGGLEKELLQSRDNLKELQQTNIKMNQELEKERRGFEELNRQYQLLSVKNEPPVFRPPKEKGKRLGVFIDNQNVYYSSRIHYGKKIDYRKLLELLVKDRHLVKAICYIVQQPEVNQDKFIGMLKSNSYVVRTRELIRRADGSAKGNWDIGIAVDVITMVEENSLDIVALVTCDGDFVDLIKLITARGIKTEVIGFPMNMAMDLKTTANEYYFITKDLMISESTPGGPGR